MAKKAAGQVCKESKFAEKKRQFANLIFAASHSLLRLYGGSRGNFAEYVCRRGEQICDFKDPLRRQPTHRLPLDMTSTHSPSAKSQAVSTIEKSKINFAGRLPHGAACRRGSRLFAKWAEPFAKTLRSEALGPFGLAFWAG